MQLVCLYAQRHSSDICGRRTLKCDEWSESMVEKNVMPLWENELIQALFNKDEFQALVNHCQVCSTTSFTKWSSPVSKVLYFTVVITRFLYYEWSHMGFMIWSSFPGWIKSFLHKHPWFIKAMINLICTFPWFALQKFHMAAYWEWLPTACT